MAVVEIARYEERPVHVAEYITPQWELVWSNLEEKLGHVAVPVFSDKKGLVDRLKKGYKPFYLPDKFSTPDKILLLADACGIKGYYLREPNLFTNVVRYSEWGYIQGSPDPSLLGLDEDGVRKAIEQKGGQVITLNEEIIASYYNKLLTGQFPDERIWTRVLGTKMDDQDLSIRFYSNGDLACSKGWAKQKSPYLGARWRIPCQS